MIQQAVITLIYAIYLKAVIDTGSDYRSDRRVHARRVAAAC